MIQRDSYGDGRARLAAVDIKGAVALYGKYGGMRKRYLQQHRPALYAQLVLEGKLVAHLNEVDDICNDRIEQVADAMAEAEGITEALKAADQMEWVRQMESICNRAEEAVCRELIYE